MIVYGNAVLYINPLIQAVTETGTIFNFIVSHHRLTLIFILFYFILLYWDDVYFAIKWHVCMPLFGFRDLVESGSLKSQPDVVCIHIREKRRWNIPSESSYKELFKLIRANEIKHVVMHSNKTYHWVK